MEREVAVANSGIGACIVEDIELKPNVKEFFELVDTIKETYKAKNNDYGSAIESGMKELGMYYLISQLHNKLSRLKSLSNPNKEQLVKSESLQDTIIDLAVYSLEGARVLNKLQRGEELEGPSFDEFLEALRLRGLNNSKETKTIIPDLEV